MEAGGWIYFRGDSAVPPTRVPRRSIGDTPPPVFWEKRLQAIENKGRESEKESKEAAGD